MCRPGRQTPPPIRLLLIFACAVGIAACEPGATHGGVNTAGTPPDAATGDLLPAPDDGPASPSLRLDFPSVDVAAGGEILEMCESISLHNPEPLFVNRVTLAAGPGWHHSNWFYVADSMYDGPDGLWPCAERRFEEFKTGLQGGILFAQSTQARSEVEQFPDGAAVVIPRNARIIGNVHLVNASPSAISTSVRLALDTLPAAAVATRLGSMSFAYFPLDLAPHAKSSFTGRCAVQAGPLDFRIFYVLPHFHGAGRGARIDVAGGPLGARTIFSTPPTTLGEPLGQRFTPPVDLRGVTDIRFTCSYQNTTDNPIHWGNANGEMCVVLAFTDSPRRWVGAVDESEPDIDVKTIGDTVAHEAPCVFAVRGE